MCPRHVLAGGFDRLRELRSGHFPARQRLERVRELRRGHLRRCRGGGKFEQLLQLRSWNVRQCYRRSNVHRLHVWTVFGGCISS